MPLRFLEFDLSEDTDGLRTWDALASPSATHTAALLAEVQALLDTLHRHLGPPGPLEDGHGWDMDLLVQDEAGQPLQLEAMLPQQQRVTLALTLCGREALTDGLSSLTSG